jgi:hypothetical protein
MMASGLGVGTVSTGIEVLKDIMDVSWLPHGGLLSYPELGQYAVLTEV